MTEKAEKNKSGAGKFFLGAAIGAAVGAIASKFIKIEADSGEEIEDDVAETTEPVAKETKKSTKPTETKKPAEAKAPAGKKETKKEESAK